jgi:ankyrin repeat protein
MGANVNTRNQDGRTPLHLASSWGHINVVSVLLNAGALVDTTDNIGSTPLYLAIRDKRVDIAQLLIDRGANVSIVKHLAIPDRVTAFIESRSNYQFVSVIIIGIHKYRRTTITGNNDINVLRLISKHIWSTRMDNVWVTPPVETKNRCDIVQ